MSPHDWNIYKKGIKPLHAEGMQDDNEPDDNSLIKKKRPIPLPRVEMPSYTSEKSTKQQKKHIEKVSRRPRQKPQTTIDLHGLTRDQAQRALLGFFQRACQSGELWVRVITGKSLKKKLMGQENETLSYNFLTWIQEPPFIAFVTGYCKAPLQDGGAGAYYVRLKKSLINRF